MSILKTHEINKFRENYQDYTKPCVCKGLKLAVLFDEKDSVKELGAKWHPDPSGKGGYWYMLENRVDQQHPNSTGNSGATIRDWLNANKMIVGTYGSVQDDLLKQLEKPFWDAPIRYELQKSNSVSGVGGVNSFESIILYFYRGIDVVEYRGANEAYGDHSQMMNLEEARTFWDDSLSRGYNRVDIVEENA
mgnify:CR=1 FL=1